MKRVLLTGATGFIGHGCIPLLLKLGYEVNAVTSRPLKNELLTVKWHQVDLLDFKQIPELLSSVKPTHLLHLAWYLVPGKLMSSSSNFLWVQASLELLRQFSEHGGTRAVFAGSSYEYDWNYGYCSESLTPKNPGNFYGLCKNSLQSMLNGYSTLAMLSSAWARIFFLYGPNEHPDRLVSSVICSLLRDEPARCSHGMQVRDYLHVYDVADALVSLLESEVQGPINIASGYPIALREIVMTIGRKLNRESLVQLGAIGARANDTPLVVGDIQRLSSELGWRPRYRLDQGLEQTIGWWRTHLGKPFRGES
jgi:nucleoside-diphosphate-sugar epimerase